MNELSKNLVCIVIRGNIEIWVEQDRADNMIALLTGNNAPQFVKYENRLINRADVVGIFTATDMEDHTRRKNGEWKCPDGEWHPKGAKCECRFRDMRKKMEDEHKIFYRRHGYYPAP